MPVAGVQQQQGAAQDPDDWSGEADLLAEDRDTHESSRPRCSFARAPTGRQPSARTRSAPRPCTPPTLDPPTCRVPGVKAARAPGRSSVRRARARALPLPGRRFAGIFVSPERGREAAGARGSGLDLRVLYRAPHVTGRSPGPPPPPSPSSRRAEQAKQRRRAGQRGVPGQPNPARPPPKKASAAGSGDRKGGVRARARAPRPGQATAR